MTSSSKNASVIKDKNIKEQEKSFEDEVKKIAQSFPDLERRFALVRPGRAAPGRAREVALASTRRCLAWGIDPVTGKRICIRWG